LRLVPCSISFQHQPSYMIPLGDGPPFLCGSCCGSSARTILCSFHLLSHPTRVASRKLRGSAYTEQRSRDNELTEQTGTVYFSNAGCNVQTCGKLLKIRSIRSCCAKTVPADNGSVACSLVVDLADQVVCRLNFRPFQSHWSFVIGQHFNDQHWAGWRRFGKRQKERYGHDYRDAGVSGSTRLTVN